MSEEQKDSVGVVGKLKSLIVAKIIAIIVDQILNKITKDDVDAIIDKVEAWAQGKEYEGAVMNVCQWVRVLASVPDEEGEDQSNPV